MGLAFAVKLVETRLVNDGPVKRSVRDIRVSLSPYDVLWVVP